MPAQKKKTAKRSSTKAKTTRSKLTKKSQVAPKEIHEIKSTKEAGHIKGLKLLSRIILGLNTLWAVIVILKIWFVKNEVTFSSPAPEIFTGALRIVVYLLMIGTIWYWVTAGTNLIEKIGENGKNVVMNGILSILVIILFTIIQHGLLYFFQGLTDTLPLIS